MKHIINIGDIFKTNSYGDIQIVERLEKGHFRVMFPDTGYTVTAHRGNIIAGKVRDHLKPFSNTITEWEDVNEERTANNGDKFIIVKKKSHRAIIKFLETNHMCEVYYENAMAGKLKDKYRKSVHGVGYLGYPENVPYLKRAKQLWQNMIKRCYCKADTRGYYGRAFVDERWHCFENFVSDMKLLDNFEGWLNSDQTGIKYNLDKDLKIIDNDTYSVETCSFVLESLNKGATSRNNYYR